MNQANTAESAIREKLLSYADPYLSQTLGEAKSEASVTLRGGVAHVELTLGFPCGDYGAELTAALETHLQPELGSLKLALELKAQITSHAVQRTLKPLTG